MLIGLASKNAILIVEFARELRIQGMSIVEAAVNASRERLRPILMTAFAFILGVVPMVVATRGRRGQPAFPGHGGIRGNDRGNLSQPCVGPGSLCGSSETAGTRIPGKEDREGNCLIEEECVFGFQ